MIQSIQNFVKGMIIGVANIIPGVSGGTLALILNIYEPLIEGIHNISWNTVKKFFRIFTFKKDAFDPDGLADESHDDKRFYHCHQECFI